MKVLYIGYYKENSEWGKMTTNFILSMHAAGIDVVPRAIELGPSRKPEGIIAELEKGSIEDCDICIQHVFPDHFVGSETFKKNIAILTNDGIEFAHTTSIEKLNQATEVWVTNTDTFNSINELLDVPVKVVHPACKIETYKKQYDQVNLGLEGFKFYTVLNETPSTDNVLSTFHSTFDASEPVQLIIFSTNPDPNFSEKVNAYSKAIKKSLRIRQDVTTFIRDAIIHMPQASETDVYALHQYADCFISSHHGDAWPVTAFDAMGFGNTPIISNVGGASEFPVEAILPVDYAFGVSMIDGNVSEINNGYDYFVQPCHKSIKSQMRKAFDAWKENPIRYTNDNKIRGLQSASMYSLEETGKKIKEALDA